MYEDFYGLSARPFLTVPDPRFLFLSQSHSLALTMLRYGLMTVAPVTVVTGEVGAGKTTLLRHLLTEIPADLTVGLVSNMQAGRGALLEWVLMAFAQPYDGLSPVRLFQSFQDFVVARYAEGKRVMLIFDEAQNLDEKTLEELRLLSNINADGNQLLQLVLVGQPELRDLLDRPALRQFKQRVVADFHLAPLRPEEVEPYIDQRLKLAGAYWKIFPPETCALIAAVTGGMPRLINTLCDLCLVSGFAGSEKTIEPALLREFLGDTERHAIYRQFRPLPPAGGMPGTEGSAGEQSAGDHSAGGAAAVPGILVLEGGRGPERPREEPGEGAGEESGADALPDDTPVLRTGRTG